MKGTLCRMIYIISKHFYSKINIFLLGGWSLLKKSALNCCIFAVIRFKIKCTLWRMIIIISKYFYNKINNSKFQKDFNNEPIKL